MIPSWLLPWKRASLGRALVNTRLVGAFQQFGAYVSGAGSPRAGKGGGGEESGGGSLGHQGCGINSLLSTPLFLGGLLAAHPPLPAASPGSAGVGLEAVPLVAVLLNPDPLTSGSLWFFGHRCRHRIPNKMWCRRPDLNRHGFPHYPLKIACLPTSTTSALKNPIRPVSTASPAARARVRGLSQQPAGVDPPAAQPLVWSPS